MAFSMIEQAVIFATKAHEGQKRKTDDCPYIAHPVSVGYILLEVGCPITTVVAGILHDVVEDTNVTLEDIRTHFGEEVAFLVKGVTEPSKSLGWEERKRHTIEHVKEAVEGVRLIVLADKINNLSSILESKNKIGERVWTHFKGNKELQHWYYSSLLESVKMKGISDPYQSLLRRYEDLLELVF
jgi:(p)ppGpp synthase/HD superfamily hydrolase